MKKCFVWLAFLMVYVMGCAPALKDLKSALNASDSGNIWFAGAGSLEPSADRTRYLPGSPVVISGDLRFPASGHEPFPAVILAHGCGGIGNNIRMWEQALQEWGYSTFVIDSFRGRNLNEVCTNRLALTSTQRIPDAYGALRILSTHPRIDPSRIALLGFSHGGAMTVGASTVWARQTYAAPGKHAFRAFIAFYPVCNIRYTEWDHIAAPLRIHTGERDDWTPAAPCGRLAEALSASGQNAAMTTYPDAYHHFDDAGFPLKHLSNVDSAAGCDRRNINILGPFPSLKGCIRQGATIGGNAKATEAARQNVRAQLAELLKP